MQQGQIYVTRRTAATTTKAAASETPTKVVENTTVVQVSPDASTKSDTSLLNNDNTNKSATAAVGQTYNMDDVLDQHCTVAEEEDNPPFLAFSVS